MIAICDSGGSKSDWAFLGKSLNIRKQGPGFNPYTHDINEFISSISDLLTPELKRTDISQLYFYGAGCGEKSQQIKVASALAPLFDSASIEVNHDLQAAARATCGHRRGIVCILGTGANSGLFDGKKFIDNIPTLGFLAGDEGGGAHGGKLIIKSYFYRDMPDDLKSKFDVFFPGGRKELLERMYSKESPNTFLASFMLFAKQEIAHPFIQSLMVKNFEEFIDTQICKYEASQKLPIHFVGSVAYHFSDILSSTLSAKKMHPGKILLNPMEELILYHQS